MKNKAGRKTILDDEMFDKAENYVLVRGAYSDDRLPSIEGLAYELNVSRESMYEWEKNNERFSYILERLRQIQATKLIDKGLNKRYDSPLTKMMLTKHGYSDKEPVEKDEVVIIYEFRNSVPRQIKGE